MTVRALFSMGINVLGGIYVELSHSLLLQLHHPVPPPPARHPLPKGKQLWKFLHSHNYIIQCHLQLCAPSQKVSNYMYVELSHSLLLQLHHPVPPPPARRPLPEGKQLWKFLHSHNYIIQCHLQLCAPSQKVSNYMYVELSHSLLLQLHHPVPPPPARRPFPEGKQLWKFLHSHNYIIQCHLQLCAPSQKVSNYMYV